MQIITAIDQSLPLENNIELFLAGGISNCPDWQSDVIQEFKEESNLTMYNPRRSNFKITDSESAKQIEWEFKRMKRSKIICFWFSRGSVNPIVLYELGKMIDKRNKILVIGIDPKYERILDVRIQVQLTKRKIEISYGLDNFKKQIKDTLYNLKQNLI